MQYATPAEAEAKLKEKGFMMSAATIRRRARAGQFPHLTIGGHLVVDIDVLLPMLEEEKARRNRVSSAELARMTGLTPTAIRRGVDEGWLPCDREGRHLRFSPERAMEALAARSEQCAAQARQANDKGRAAGGGEGKE